VRRERKVAVADGGGGDEVVAAGRGHETGSCTSAASQVVVGPGRRGRTPVEFVRGVMRPTTDVRPQSVQPPVDAVRRPVVQRQTADRSRQPTVAAVVVAVVLVFVVVLRQLAEQAARAREPDQLALERPVGEHDAASVLDDARDGEQRQPALEHHVRDADRRAAVDAERAVHEHRAAVALRRVQETERLAEMPRDVVPVAVFRLYTPSTSR